MQDTMSAIGCAHARPSYPKTVFKTIIKGIKAKASLQTERIVAAIAFPKAWIENMKINKNTSTGKDDMYALKNAEPKSITSFESKNALISVPDVKNIKA